MVEFECNLATVINELQDEINALKVHPRCKANMAASTIVPSGVLTPIAMSTVEYDTDNIHTSDPTKFQINKSGLYLIVHQNSVLTLADSMDPTIQFYINICIMKNGTDQIAIAQPASDQSVSALVYLNAGDYIQPAIIQSSGVTVKATFTSIYVPYISIVKISD